MVNQENSSPSPDLPAVLSADSVGDHADSREDLVDTTADDASSALVPMIPTRWTSPWTGTFLAVFAIIALYCSLGLLETELEVLRNPHLVPECDINPLIGCSDSLLSPQAHLLFGLPNSAVGLIAFGAVLGLAAVLIFKGSLPRIVWWGASAGLLVGVFYIIYFLVQSTVVFDSLCPYCMGVWASILAAAPLVWGATLVSGSLGARAQIAGRPLFKYWWAIAILFYLAVLLVIILTMSDKVAMLF